MHNNSSDSMKRVRENDWVLVKRIFDEGFRLVRAERESCYYLVKQRVNTDSLIGASFGSMMELNKKGKKLVPVDLSEEEMFELSDLHAASEVAQPELPENECRDNRNLIDDHGSSQRLTMEQIESLKTQASSDMEIIHNLCQNSSTFAEKSLFSQAKYIKKKKQKYTNFFMIYKPTVRLLCDMYFNQRPGKVTTLRLDTLSQLLNSCNVRSGGRYIVVDNFHGLLPAAVIERLVGDGVGFPVDRDAGSCIQMYLEQGPTATWRTCVEALNLPASLLTPVLLSYPIHLTPPLLNSKTDQESGTKAETETSADSVSSVVVAEHRTNGQSDGVGGEWETKKRKLDEKSVERNRRRAERREEEAKARLLLLHRNLDSFILMTRNFDPCLPAQILIEFLAPSAPFAIFSPIIEPLAQCMLLLKSKAVNLRLSDTWLRRYQILRERTRPDMNMSGSGGFILTGTKIA